MLRPKLPRWSWMLPILVLTVVLGLAHINSDVLWMDEWFTYYRAGGGPLEPISVPQIIENTTIYLSWPPGYFLSIAAWDWALDGNPYTDRLFSLFMGLLAVSAIYRLGRRLHSDNVGLVAALALCTCAFFVYYLHELRPYTLYVLSVILAAWFYWMLLTNPRAGLGLRVGFALSIGLALYTHYIAALCVLALGLYHVLFERPHEMSKRSIERRQWLTTLRWWVNGCLLFTPWIAVALISVYNETLADRGAPLPLMLYNIGLMFSNGLFWLNLLLLLTLRWWKMPAVRFLWVWVSAVLALTIAGSAYADFLFHPRHVMGILPMVVLLFVFTLMMIWQWNQAAAALLLGLWVGVGLIHSLSPMDFIRQPSHMAGIPKVTNDTLVEIGQTCIAPEDFAVYGISTADEAHYYDVPLNNNLGDMDYLYNHLASLVASPEHPSILFPETFPEAFYTLPPAERVQQVTANRNTVWVFTLPDVPIQSDLLALNKLLHDAGFNYCGAVVDRPDLYGGVYTRDRASCRQVVTSCGG